MRKPIVAANWKMNGSRELCKEFARNLSRFQDVEVLIFPSALYIAQLVSDFQDASSISVGIQNIFKQPSGAFTGEISAEMAADAGATHVLIGHSERRSLFGETDRVVAEKLAAAYRAGLKAVVCVGETLDEHMNNQAEEVVERQLQAILEFVTDNTLLAYEPVWAIGTGKTALPDQANGMQELMRKKIHASHVVDGESIRILYGGSINADNAPDLIRKQNIDGYLVGGSSLKVDQFNQICEAVRV